MIKSAFSTHNIWRKQQTFQELIREGESDAERQTLESKVPDIEGWIHAKKSKDGDVAEVK